MERTFFPVHFSPVRSGPFLSWYHEDEGSSLPLSPYPLPVSRDPRLRLPTGVRSVPTPRRSKVCRSRDSRPTPDRRTVPVHPTRQEWVRSPFLPRPSLSRPLLSRWGFPVPSIPVVVQVPTTDPPPVRVLPVDTGVVCTHVCGVRVWVMCVNVLVTCGHV